MDNVVGLQGFIAELSLKIGDQWINKCDGCGVTRMEPVKGSISGAFKRVASIWGIGRYLYDLRSQWVELDHFGNFKTPNLPSWALPEGEGNTTGNSENSQNTEISFNLEDALQIVVKSGNCAGKKMEELNERQLTFLTTYRSATAEEKGAARVILASQKAEE